MNLIKENFLKNINNDDMLNIVECIIIAENAGLLVEVIYTALEEMKKHPELSPLSCLHAGLDGWGI
jgi:hypothetical protein